MGRLFRRDAAVRVTRDLPGLGAGTFDPLMKRWSVTVPWQGQQVALHLEASTEAMLNEAVRLAQQVCTNSAAWQRDAEISASAHLLETANVWVEPGANGEIGEVTPASFVEAISLRALDVDPDGNLTFWFDDGGLFAGHHIQVIGDVVNGFDHAQILG